MGKENNVGLIIKVKNKGKTKGRPSKLEITAGEILTRIFEEKRLSFIEAELERLRNGTSKISI